MAWTNKQKQIASMSCKEAGIDDAARKFILRQFPNAILPGSGEPSSTAAALTQRDFEGFMAIVEDRAGGELRACTAGYWQSKAGSRSTSASERQAQLIRDLYQQLVYAGGGLQGHGTYGFDGLVRRVTNQRTVDLDQLKPREGHNMIEMLRAMVDRQRNKARRAKASDRQSRLFSDRELTAAGGTRTQNRERSADDPPRRVMTGDDIPF